MQHRNKGCVCVFFLTHTQFSSGGTRTRYRDPAPPQVWTHSVTFLRLCSSLWMWAAARHMMQDGALVSWRNRQSSLWITFLLLCFKPLRMMERISLSLWFSVLNVAPVKNEISHKWVLRCSWRFFIQLSENVGLQTCSTEWGVSIILSKPTRHLHDGLMAGLKTHKHININSNQKYLRKRHKSREEEGNPRNTKGFGGDGGWSWAQCSH